MLRGLPSLSSGLLRCCCLPVATRRSLSHIISLRAKFAPRNNTRMKPAKLERSMVVIL